MRPAVDLLFPPTCVGCHVFCTADARAAPQNDPAYPTLCNQCCRRILITHTTQPIGGAASYNNAAVRALVQELKFHGVQAAAAPLAFFIARHLAVTDLITRPERTLLMPVPLGAARLRERGFNQAALIAREVSRRTGVAVAVDTLVRRWNTVPQTAMHGVEARLENLDDVFRLCVPLEPRSTDLLLIDDVTTSGATFTQARHAIRQGGYEGRITCVAAAWA